MPVKKEDYLKYVRILSVMMLVGVAILSMQGLLLQNPFFTDYALLLIILTLLFVTTILYLVTRKEG